MACGHLESPPTRSPEWGPRWIGWLHEVYKRISLGPCHGSMYQYELGTIITISASGTYYPITTMTAGLLKGITFASDQLTVAKGASGRYKVEIEVSLERAGGGGGSALYEIALLVNSTVHQPSAAHASCNGALHSNIHGSGFVDLAVGDVLELGINNHTSTTNADIEHASLTLLRIGDVPR